MKVKNISNDNQAVPNFPAFKPGESRDVTEKEAEILLANPNFSTGSSSYKKSESKKKNESFKSKDYNEKSLKL